MEQKLEENKGIPASLLWILAIKLSGEPFYAGNNIIGMLGL